MAKSVKSVTKTENEDVKKVNTAVKAEKSTVKKTEKVSSENVAKNSATDKAVKSAPKKRTPSRVKKNIDENAAVTENKKIPTEPLPEITVRQKKKIIFVGSEAAPFIATGGLADVLGSLPKALAERGNLDVSVILPLYRSISQDFKSQFKFMMNFNVSVGWRWQYAGVFLFEYGGVKFYFIDNEYYFKREGNIYGFYDDGERFAFFSRAALDTIARLNIYPDILHCNDWQTAASIIFLKGMYYGDENFRRIKTVFTIHNIEYQGIFGMDTFESLFGFSSSLKQFVEFDGNVNLMKGAIEMTDIVTTVSPTYAEEIKDPFYAHRLENIIRRNANKLVGILNGIDTEYYNPETDKYLFANYSSEKMEGKAVCKGELQRMLGLSERSDVPIVAIISRLVSHKGLDLVRTTIESFLSQDVQVVVLGKGEIAYENYFRHLSEYYKGKCAAVIAYNQDLSRKIYSGADIFLMPSKAEPCGLSQMIASRYGTVPVVRETGGLNDSIKAYTGEHGNGFTFKNYNAHDMLYVLNEAVRTYKNHDEWRKLVKRVMETDFSWKNQAEKYERLYGIDNLAESRE